jgi:hypothetical protein
MEKPDIKKEVIFNFTQLYYMYFIEKMERINNYMVSEKNYPMALSELNQRFNELNYTIAHFDKKLYEDIYNLIEENRALINEYQGIEQTRRLNRKDKPIILNAKAVIIEEKMNVLYRLIMETIDRMDMLLKKVKIDDNKAIYQDI